MPMEHLRTLVLNSTFEPLQFTSSKRALILSMLGKAEPLEFDGFYIRTPTKSFRLPTVIKLNRFIKRPFRSYVSFSKKNVLRRDNHTCQYCGHRGPELTIDHVIPRSQNGGSTWDNVVTACRKCNLKKGNRTKEESGMKLVSRPRRPKFLFHSSLPDQTPVSHLKSWAKYMPRVYIKL